MRITERRLRRVIRSVIKESLDIDLNNKMLNILNDLRDNVHACESGNLRCLGMINMAVSRMSDEWNHSGGDETGGPFVKNCDIGIAMNRIQHQVHNDPTMMIDDILSELDLVGDVIENCDFYELSAV